MAGEMVESQSQMMSRLDPPLWVVTSGTMEEPAGLLASFVYPASIDRMRPRFMVGLARPHQTCLVAKTTGAVVLHLLSETESDYVMRFAGKHGYNGKNQKKFEGLNVVASRHGVPRLADAKSAVECRVVTVFEGVERLFFLVEAEAEIDSGEDFGVLTWSKFAKTADEAELNALGELLRADVERDRRAIS